MKIKKIILSVFLMNFNYINIFSGCCNDKNNNKNKLINNNKNENNSENNENKDNENKDKKQYVDNLEKLLPDKLIYKNSFYKWSGDYCGIQCCCYFLATLLYNEDKILKEFTDSNIKFLNNIAQIVNDFKNNNFNNKCHELLFNSICDLFFEIGEKLKLEDFEKQENEKNINYEIFKDCLYTIDCFEKYETNKNVELEDFNLNDITLSQYIENFNYFKQKEDFLSIFKNFINNLKIKYQKKDLSHSANSFICDKILNLLSYLNNKISFKYEDNKCKIILNNKNKFISYDQLLNNNINLIYSFYHVNYGSIGHGCCFYYNFNDKKYYFVSNEKEIEVSLEYIINPKISEKDKINLLYKKINEQKIINYDYKLESEIKYLYKL